MSNNSHEGYFLGSNSVDEDLRASVRRRETGGKMGAISDDPPPWLKRGEVARLDLDLVRMGSNLGL